MTAARMFRPAVKGAASQLTVLLDETAAEAEQAQQG